MSRRVALVGLVVAAASVLIPVVRAAAPAGPFAGCAPPPTAGSAITVEVGTVTCQQIDSTSIGGRTAFSYFVPPGCAPARGVSCPVLYMLHGFGGDLYSMVGTGADPSSWVAALDHGPRVDPATVPDPWNLADTSRWKPRSPLDMVLIAPHGRTVPGGYGPQADLDGYWTDWNPRYAAGGDTPSYATPAPRFATFANDELPALVEASFPVGRGREWRAITGTSLGGFGSFLAALQHPDRYTSVGSVSGAHTFLFTPWLDPAPMGGPLALQPPAGLPSPIARPPGLSSLLTGPLLQTPAGAFLAATLALGDPVADQAWFRGHTPRDLAMNGRAYTADGAQTLFLTAFVNDTIPRRAQDVTNPVSIAFEDVVLPMNLSMQLALRGESVASDFAIHQGLHSEPYRAPWLRGMLEKQYARMRHADGGGAPLAPATVFDHRSTAERVDVWGWSFAVERPTIEFLTLRGVSCRGLSLQGTGTVTVTVPDACGTGLDGHRTFTVDLGPTQLTDEPLGLGALPIYGRTVTLTLTSA
jgi:S-formylglutathione hydrolase FrmB